MTTESKFKKIQSSNMYNERSNESNDTPEMSLWAECNPQHSRTNNRFEIPLCPNYKGIWMCKLCGPHICAFLHIACLSAVMQRLQPHICVIKTEQSPNQISLFVLFCVLLQHKVCSYFPKKQRLLWLSLSRFFSVPN